MSFSALQTDRARAEPQEPTLAPGQEFARRYRIEDEIGSGGMGTIYRAIDLKTEEPVALKLIRPDRLKSKDAVIELVREGAVARRIRHDNVVSVFDVDETDGVPFISMELLQGRTLRSWHRHWLATREDVPFPVVAEIILQICAGLKAAHAQDIIHRDLKPENVFLLGEPHAGAVKLKLLDFGLARASAAAPGAGSSGGGAGTVHYRAPEQQTSDIVYPATDIYALSRIFYELLAGVVIIDPWHPPSDGRSDVPKEIDDLIRRCTLQRPSLRVQDVATYEAIVRSAINAKAASPARQPDRPRPAPPPGPSPQASPGPNPWFEASDGKAAAASSPQAAPGAVSKGLFGAGGRIGKAGFRKQAAASVMTILPLFVAVGLFIVTAAPPGTASVIAIALMFLAVAGMFNFGVAVVKRLHDFGRHYHSLGFQAFLFPIGLYHGLFRDGDPGPNAFGDPVP